jgi:hypothetical protein
MKVILANQQAAATAAAAAIAGRLLKRPLSHGWRPDVAEQCLF